MYNATATVIAVRSSVMSNIFPVDNLINEKYIVTHVLLIRRNQLISACTNSHALKLTQNYCLL